MRLSAWCAAPSLALNGRAVTFDQRDGYALVRRRWRDGDRLTLTVPMAVRAEPARDDPRTFAFLSGPLVLAADLGEAARPVAWPAPALRQSDPLTALRRLEGQAHAFQLAAHGGDLRLVPFYALYDRRTAPYLR